MTSRWSPGMLRGALAGLPASPGKLRVALAGLAASLGVMLFWLAADRWASGEAGVATRDVAVQAARDHAGLLSNELQKFRLLPLVLVEYPDVAAAVTPDGVAAGKRLDRILELLAGRAGAAAIYVIDAKGRTVAASNAQLPTSFVGHNYGFRPYFREAMRNGASEAFALGTVSGRPGLYLARRLGDGSGVVVVKVEFDRVEQSWANGAGISFMIDGDGVILITSKPDWRFRATHTLAPATIARARETHQFGAAPLLPAPLVLAGDTASATAEGRLVDYRVAIAPVPLAGARLVHLAPLAPALAAATTRVRLWLLALLLVIGLVAVVVIRSRERRNMQLRVRLQTEREESRVAADENEHRRIRETQAAENAHRERGARERSAMLDALAREFEDSISTIIEAVSRSSESLLMNAEKLAQRAEQTKLESTTLDRESGEMAQSMQIAAAATDELMVSFAEIGRQVDGSHQVATSACLEAEKAGDMVSMLAQEAERIEAVVGTISQIASRTNLLALNATIEAARAGESGHGFAVVANEVKNLAGQTGGATSQVRGQISGIQASAADVVDATRSIMARVQSLNQVASMVAVAVGQQVSAGSQIAGVLAAAVNKTDDMVRASGHIRRSADQSNIAANDVRAAVDQLQQHFSQLRSDAERFLTHIRAT